MSFVDSNFVQSKSLSKKMISLTLLAELSILHASPLRLSGESAHFELNHAETRPLPQSLEVKRKTKSVLVQANKEPKLEKQN